MEEMIFLKNKKTSLWESNPHLAFGIYLIFYLILFFGSIVVTAFGNIPGIVLVVWLILMTIMFCFNYTLKSSRKHVKIHCFYKKK